MSKQFSIDALNAMSAEEFTAALGAIFEHSPWVAQRAAAKRPFRNLQQLHEAMAQAVRSASQEEQLALIRAHPELAGKAAVRGELTEESTREQKGAGLDQCSPEEFARMQDLNRRYNDKFGFPFVIAVKGHNRQSILDNFAKRLENDRATEAKECIEQIIRIGGFRLADAIR
ncbi:2-oxo-4-hydroxy-4-carboxy-5-ureidoimidazoline decarboxylase [Noviherbaspirillum massiliense]|uniref:2-oxo-4-hydroxy-4-carboxy-5-ureidoimidazoline decarboxylase n=1 Tax=Noviherbaspirillum massiliense TaxID=1465823 RepID=UPI00031DAF36|nr:2-oxo-4-hydroxy-4-carboxy-5-ureidoimidazoline decarboxylase [Noviherbaspirillum massiliense]